MPNSTKTRKDLEQTMKFLLKEVDRIDKLEAKLIKAGDRMHPVSRGFLEQMIERRTEYRPVIKKIGRAIDDLKGTAVSKSPKIKN